jgi:hypothetical protein
LQLDDETLEDLKDDLIYAKHLAMDKDAKVLVWVGELAKSRWVNPQRLFIWGVPLRTQFKASSKLPPLRASILCMPLPSCVDLAIGFRPAQFSNHLRS